MQNLKLIIFITWTILLSACGGSDNKVSVKPDTTLNTNDAFEVVLNAHNVPAIAGMHIKQGVISEQFALGQRSAQNTMEVSLSDRWHIGSITKSFTATLAARLIETDVIQWDTQIQDIFNADEYNQKFAEITLIDLLSHTSGIEADVLKVSNWNSYFDSDLPITTQRQIMAKELMNMPGSKIGQFNYSNGGYVVAGAMLERVMATNWETLLEEYVLLPMDINDAQFGAPYDGVELTQPYGHNWKSGNWQAVNPTGKYADNPKVIGPAGTLNMSLNSLQKYAQIHLQGNLGNNDFLTTANFKRLHQEVANTNYALGWAINNKIISHNGSNTMWFAVLAINLSTQTITIAATNAGGSKGDNVTQNIMNTLVQRNGS